MGLIKPLTLPQCPLHYVSIKVSTLINTYFKVPPPAPLVLLSGQAFHFSYIINVFLSLSPPCSKKVFIYLKFKVTKIQAVSSSAAVSNVTVLCE